MGHELQRRTPATVTRADPSWPAVASTTVRLWFDRHYRRRAGHRRLVIVLSALVAMALGAGVTLAFTQRDTGSAGSGTHAPNAIQVAQADRQQAAGWIAREVASNIVVACDLEMCNQLQKSGFPGARLLPLQPTSPDPLGAQLVVATPVIRNQFGTRLASVYAPLVIASFGSGAERVDVRFVAPDGTKAFEAELATDRKARIAAGEQLLANNHVQASAEARNVLLAGRADPRLPVFRHHDAVPDIIIAAGEIVPLLPEGETIYPGGGFQHPHTFRHDLLTDAVARNDGDAVDAIGGHGARSPAVRRACRTTG